MAATTNRLFIQSAKSGQIKTVSTYNAANGAVGTYLPVDTSQIATANSPNEFNPATDCILKDWQAGAASGEVQIIADGNPTGFFLGYDAQQPSNAGRAIPLGYQFVAGVTYRFRVESVLPA